MNKEEIDYIDKYNEFWKDIVENEDGTLNKDQVMRELSDYSMVLDNCSDAYYAMTNGKISKQNTKFFEVENIFNNEFIDMKYYDELQQENQKYKEVIDKAINNSQYWIDYYTRLNSDERIALRLQENIDILKEVE